MARGVVGEEHPLAVHQLVKDRLAGDATFAIKVHEHGEITSAPVDQGSIRLARTATGQARGFEVWHYLGRRAGEPNDFCLR